MKIVNFQGGLGNQMFIYVFYLYLKRTHPHEHIFGSYWSNSLHEHNDFQLEDIFDITLPTHNFLTDAISKFSSLMERLHIVSTEENKYSIFYNGYWLDKKYFEGIDLSEIFTFRSKDIGNRNRALLERIEATNSVSLHIRRGDYQNEENKKLFGAYSSLNYYKRAIERELSLNPKCQFFVFSDDIEWTKQNMIIPNALFIENNKGNNSWIDMYLMSKCKDNIIANSTFSWWAATLNKARGKRVLYPKKWFYWGNPNIFPADWIAIDNL